MLDKHPASVRELSHKVRQHRQTLRQENKRMAKFFEIGLDRFGFYIETRLVDLYIDNRGLALGVAVIVALRVRKVIKTRKVAK